ncbi:leucine-rich repeat domain-containing protein [Aquimarina sp. 2-A2]|uniref:leucine-rich repeat domain-containing protein n=1 Tax=Aquimarina sp. 2-A2 TaxID=3382644 RepID=UPI00387F1852
MNKIFHILFLSFFVLSCSPDNDEPTIPIEGKQVEGKQVFRIDLKKLTAKNLSVGNKKNQEPAFALLSLNDVNENPILTREKVSLKKDSDSNVTAEFTLESGTYTVIEFIVIDANDVVISMAPKENSALAQFVTNPLPFDFVVPPNETKETVIENINAAGYTSVNFGYTGLSLTLPENTDFFSLTVDESISTTTKTLNIKSITGSTYLVDWGDGTIDEYVSTIPNSGIDNTISHSYTQNEVYTINVSGAIEAIELLDFTSTQEDNWVSNLSTINIDKLILLKSCMLYAGKLTELNTSENVALELLGVGYNDITSLDLSNNPKLTTLFLGNNQLTELNLTQNPDIKDILVDDNLITSFDFSKNSELRGLMARENNLSNIDLSNNLKLEHLDISNNTISNIDVSLNLSLIEINVGANNLTEIDLSKNTNLKRIDLYQNQISSIDISNNTILRDIYISDNLLSEIDVSNNPDLERLIIEGNNFNSLDLTSVPKVFDLEIGNNLFEANTLDEIIYHIHEQATLNSITNGYMDFKNNPGFDGISNASLIRINELISSYNWFFNNNNYRHNSIVKNY